MAWATPKTDWTPANGVADTDFNRIEENTRVLGEYDRAPAKLTVTTNSGNAYSVTLAPVAGSYYDGLTIRIRCNAASTGSVTINVNGLGAKNVVKSNGVAVSNWAANGVYTLVYNSTTGNFMSQGEGGEMGKLANLIKNGSFENDLNCWDVNMNASIVATPVKSGSKSVKILASNSRAYCGINRTGVEFVPQANSKYYMCGWYYVTSFASGAPRLKFRCTSPATENDALINTALTGQWQFLSIVFDTTGYTLTACDYFALHDGGISTSTFDIKIDGVMLINLTDAFGAGKEPSQAEMDALVQANGGWWDSSLPILVSDGTVSAGDMLSGKVGYTGGGWKVVGTITNRTIEAFHQPAQQTTVGDFGQGLRTYFRPPGGYYDGSSWVYASSPDLIASNILSGKNIFGVTGSYSPSVFTAGNGVTIASADTERAPYSDVYAIQKDIEVVYGGSYRVTWEMKAYSGWYAYGRVYVNGSAVGTEKSQDYADWNLQYQDVTVNAGDNIQLYVRSSQSGINAWVRNFRLTVITSNLATVVTN